MDDNKITDDYNDKSQWEEPEAELTDACEREEADITTGRERLLTRAAETADDNFIDMKQYPEKPFTQFEAGQVNVQLSSGTFRYDMVDFVLPGRDGFDLSIIRRYDSNCANTVDMTYEKNNLGLRTGSRENRHNIRTYGLGIGWSFILPSIESISQNHILHLEDGRSLKIGRVHTKFDDYTLEDVKIINTGNKTQTIGHPYTGNEKDYDLVVEYRNGNKDYFCQYTQYGTIDNNKVGHNFKLVARQDRFGNVILFEITAYGGMKIVDTWGRTLTLEKTGNMLTWKLPEVAPDNIPSLSYEIESQKEDNRKPLRLKATTNLLGKKTQYDYYDPARFTSKMECASYTYAGNTVGKMDRPYLLLKSVTYPNGVMTNFEHNRDKTIRLDNENGGYIISYPLLTKTDQVGDDKHNEINYSYAVFAGSTGKSDYVYQAIVTLHGGDIEENYGFSDKGLMKNKTVLKKKVRVSRGDYEYDDNKLMTSAVETVYSENSQEMVMTKKSEWEYDNRVNVTKLLETYEGDSMSNREVNTVYGEYSIPTKIETTVKKKEGSQIIENKIRKENELSEDSQKKDKIIVCNRIYEQDALKEKTVYVYEDDVNPYCVSRERRYIREENGNLEGSGRFTETIYRYDSSKYTHKYISKEQIGIKDADGNNCTSVKEMSGYDGWGRNISRVDARGYVSTFKYDILGRLMEEKLPLTDSQFITNTTSYNDDYNYIIKTDANHQKLRIEYTPLGKIARVCLMEPKGTEYTDVVLRDFRYDLWGELTEVITYDGNGTAANHIRKTECYTYDAFGRILTRSVPQVGYEECFHYDEVYLDMKDPAGTLYSREQRIVKGDSPDLDIETEAYKDIKGQVRKEFLGGDLVFRYDYDNAGNLIQKVDGLDKAERLRYDYAGRPIESTRMDAGQERTIRTQYDAQGRKQFTFDEAGNKTEFQYDGAGRLIKVIAPFDNHEQIVKYYYDAAGNITWEKKNCDNGWLEVQHVYDARGRLTDTYQYLSQDNWIRTNYQYDAMDRVTRVRTGDTPSGNGQQVTTYTYDRFGNIITMTDARGCSERYEYDKIGRLVKKTDRNGSQTVYQYDALDRLKKETVSSNTVDGELVSEREYAYSKNGKRLREVSRETREGGQPVSLETRYYYDNKGQLIRQEDPGNVEKVYTYDLSGNHLSFRLLRQGQAAHDISLFYAYDDLHRLKQVRKDSSGNVVLAEYEYDARGNRKALRYPQAGMETCYTYNAGGRVISLENKKRGVVTSAWSYDYDVSGNMLKKTCMTGNTTSVPFSITYNYDRLGRLTKEDYPGWKRTLYTYDADSNRTGMTVQGMMKDELVSVTSYQYGLNNRLEKEIKKQGKITETYQYRYDNNGSEIFRIWEKTAPTPEYRGSVELPGSWKRNTPTVYEWRHYNGFHQLVQVNQDEQEITYQYRGDGLRHSSDVRKLKDSQSKRNMLYWDGMNIVAEQVEGEGTKHYLRGISLIAREIDYMLYYYIINEHGDVAELWGENGTCKATYEYDGFGNGRSFYGDDDNSFRYCGEYLDLSSSVYYLRNRDYRPTTGRFLTEDTYWNTSNMIYGNNPIQFNGSFMPNVLAIMASGNLYVYCLNNSLTYRDPLGLAPIAISDFVKSQGTYESSWNIRGDKYTFTVNERTLSYNGSGKNKHEMNMWVENDTMMAQDYDLAYFFRVDGWIEYMPGFEWKEDYLLRVDVHQYFLSRPFNLDFAKEVTRMKGNDSLYEGLTEKGIAAESFVHAQGYYWTDNLTQYHPEIASINNSSAVIDIANFDDRIWKFEAIWDVFFYVKGYLINYDIFR